MSDRKQTTAGRLAALVVAFKNCQQTGNAEWRDRHRETLLAVVREQLPGGSGIDNGTSIDLEKSDGRKKLVLFAAFHHMNPDGYYDGWTEHDIVVRPAFDGIDVQVSGSNRNGIRDYLAEVYADALCAECES